MSNVLYRVLFNTELEFAAPTELYDDSGGWRDEWRDVEPFAIRYVDVVDICSSYLCSSYDYMNDIASYNNFYTELNKVCRLNKVVSTVIYIYVIFCMSSSYSYSFK